MDWLPETGSHVVTAIVDGPISRVVELEENSNTARLETGVIQRLYPNLTITRIWHDPSDGRVPAGRPLRLMAEITNTGQAAVPAGFIVRTHVDGVFAGDVTTVGPLAVGQTETVTLDWPVVVGEHEVVCEVDPDSVIPGLLTEIDTTNNLFTGQMDLLHGLILTARSDASGYLRGTDPLLTVAVAASNAADDRLGPADGVTAHLDLLDGEDQVVLSVDTSYNSMAEFWSCLVDGDALTAGSYTAAFTVSSDLGTFIDRLQFTVVEDLRVTLRAGRSRYTAQENVILAGEVLTVGGQTVPGIEVSITVTGPTTRTFTVVTDGDGQYRVSFKPVGMGGEYQATARVEIPARSARIRMGSR